MRRTERDRSPSGDRGPRLRALVVFASLVGDTAQIARAVVAGLDGDFDSVVAEVFDVDPQDASGFDVIITGEPSQMFGVGIGHPEDDLAVRLDNVAMKDWLTNLPEARERQYCACFDTSTRPSSSCGEVSSVNSIRILHEHGYVVLSRQTFHVASIGGPLLGGEIHRAKGWAQSLAARIPL